MVQNGPGKCGGNVVCFLQFLDVCTVDSEVLSTYFLVLKDDL